MLNFTKLAISIIGNGYAGTYISIFLEIGSMNKIKTISCLKSSLTVFDSLLHCHEILPNAGFTNEGDFAISTLLLGGGEILTSG